MSTAGSSDGRATTAGLPMQVGRVCGVVVAVIGLTVMAGYHLHNPMLVKFHTTNIAMLYNTALVLVLAGFGLIGLSVDRPRLAMVGGGFTALVGALTVIEWSLQVDLAADFNLSGFRVYQAAHPERMAGNTAMAFALAGVAMLLLADQRERQWSSRVPALLGPLVAAVGGVGLLGYLSHTESAYKWGHLNAMAAHTGLAVMLLGIGVAAFAWEQARVSGAAPTWLSVVVALGLTAGTLLLWHAISEQARTHLTRTIDTEADLIRSEIEARMEARTLALIRTARRWEYGGAPTQDVWAFDASLSLAHYPGFQAIEYVDAQEVVRWVVPGPGNEMVVGRSLVTDPIRRRLLDSARRDRQPRVSPTVDLLQGGRGFLIVVPIFRPSRFEGYQVGVFRIDQLLRSVLNPDRIARGYGLQILDGDQVVFQRGTPPVDAAGDWLRTLPIHLYGTEWTVRVWPTMAAIEEVSNPLPEVVLATGLGLAWLMGLVIYLAQTAELRAREAEAANTALQTEVGTRREAELALQRQADELARSNADLEQFAYVASHDLQEPLRMVASYLQLLERRYKPQLDQDAQEFIAYAVDGANRMRALVNDLLAYSRVGTRGNPFEPCDLASVAERALANLQVAIEESEAEVTVGQLPRIHGDPTQLIQLFQNLIANALKFRRDRTPEVEVGARREGAWWTVWVRDNGIGIAPEYAQRVFLIFQRLHSRAEYEGTGIGLAICKKIVERHGGRIWLEPAPGQGTTFLFTLPVAEDVPDESTPAEPRD